MSIQQIKSSMIPAGEITASDLASSLDLTSKTVTLPPVSKGVLQSVYAKLNGTPSFAGNQSVWVDTGLSAAITPTSSSSKIMIMVSFIAYHSSSGADNNFRLLVNGEFFNVNTSPDSGSSTPNAIGSNFRGADEWNQGFRITYTTLHSPGTTSTQTYRLQATTEVSNLVMNRGNQSGNTRFGNSPAELVLLEVSA
jgi:hypothetical protein